MKFSPWILGAALIAPIAGAVAGSSISTEPIAAAQDVTALLPEKRQLAYPAPVERGAPPPNHYELETPDGTVPVTDLAFRGRHPDRYRLAQQIEAAQEAELAAWEKDYQRGYAEADYSDERFAQQATVAGAVETSRVAMNSMPEPSQQPPAPLTDSVSTVASGARILNVTAALNQ